MAYVRKSGTEQRRERRDRDRWVHVSVVLRWHRDPVMGDRLVPAYPGTTYRKPKV